MTRALAGALVALLLLALPVTAKTPASLDLLTPGPYHYGGTIDVVAHGDYPTGRLYKERSTIQLRCFQGGGVVYTERVDDPVAGQTYTLHFGQSGLSQWDLNGGGAADCVLRFTEVDRHPILFSRYELHVEG
jgi:hypothetical protein